MSSTPSSKISSVIIWSVISAAFIGPGTVTTAVTAGSQFQIQLLWAVVFATISCIVLQEASARIVIASGLNFGQALENKFGSKVGNWIKWIVAGPVLMGCAAYEAGNILGAVSGTSILMEGNGQIYTTVITITAGLILWHGGNRWISTIMTLLVGIMGVTFLILAMQGEFIFSEIIKSALVPTIPEGSAWLTLALVGTTIVPYNIFIGSAISKGHTIPLMRLGLTISVLIGGLITCWIMFAGAQIGGFASFSELAYMFQHKIGMIGSVALGLGLFAAGFSSAITSPYAASLIASTVFGAENKNVIRFVWMTVLLTGFAFGISGIKPIPVILTVQALNGLILPLITYFLILLVNDSKIVSTQHRHAAWYDLVLLAILGTTLVIGFNNVDKAIISAFALSLDNHFKIIGVITSAIVAATVLQLIRLRKIHPDQD
jgi:Mn2+/Fe2+ NRAMP family transporter